MMVPSGINQGYRLGIALRSFSIHYPVGIDVVLNEIQRHADLKVVKVTIHGHHSGPSRQWGMSKYALWCAAPSHTSARPARSRC